MNQEVGKKGAVLFRVYNEEKNFDIDTERKVLFKKNILDEKNNKTFEVGCGPWIDEFNFYIFCEFDEKIPKGEYSFKFNENEDRFNYSRYEIHLNSDNIYKITKIDLDKADLYSGPQTINVTDNKESYELKFKIKSYNQERLYLQNNIDEPLECNRKNEELICPIKKSSLECYSSSYPIILLKLFSLFYFSKSGRMEPLLLVSFITYNFKVQKKDVNIEITKLLTDYVEKSNYIAYETNLINFPSLMALLFNLTFIGKEEKEKDLSCMLRKGQNTPLLILCESSYNHKDEISLKEIKNNYIINNINAKYNFIIKPVNNNQKINIINNDYTYSIIPTIYPNILDFTSNDSFDIDLYLDEQKNVAGVTFNQDVEDLKCENLTNILR